MLVFHPRDAAPPYLQALVDAGWSTTGIVVISQLVAFLSYQIRVVAGLARPESEARMTDKVLSTPPHVEPVVFTRDMLDWLPWLEPMAEQDLTERHMAGLVDAARAKSAYFRLLVRDPEVLEHRTKTDKDIFYNPEAGLPRAERELAAAATSRFNGCIYCASVHARFAATYSKRVEDVQRLLDEGVGADLDARWNAIVAASVALTATPITFGPEHVDAPAQGRAGRGVDRRRDQRRVVLQLGEPADAVAGRAGGAGKEPRQRRKLGLMIPGGADDRQELLFLALRQPDLTEFAQRRLFRQAGRPAAAWRADRGRPASSAWCWRCRGQRAAMCLLPDGSAE